MSDSKKNNEKKSKNIINELGPYLSLGLEMAATVGVMALFGWWLDGKFETEPYLILTFSLLGIVVAFYNFFRTISRLEKKNKSGKKK